MSLTPKENSLLEKLGFETEAAELLRDAVKGSLLLFKPTGGELSGVAVMVADGDAAEVLMKTVQPSLIQRGYRAFWTDISEDDGIERGSAVVMIHSTDHFAILDAVKPRAESHAGPEIIREKLKSYEHLCNLEIVGAAPAWVAVSFKSLPADLCAFAEDVYLFCPDSCDINSGIGSRRKITKQIRDEATVLCPSVSKTFRERLKVKHSHAFSSGALPDDFFDMLADDAEWNVRLVARELKDMMYFFFWRD